MEKGTVYLILTIGSGIGSYLPVIFGVDLLSGWSILGGMVGGLASVWVIYRLN